MLFVAACAAMSVKAQGPFDLNLFSKVSYESVSSTIFASAVDNNGVVSVKAGAKIKDAWDNQFWIDAPEIMVAGTPFTITMDVKAEKESSVGTQLHNGAGNYVDYMFLGNVNFGKEWASNSYVGNLSKDGKTVAFNLNDFTEANTYYFKNITWAPFNASYTVDTITFNYNGDLKAENFMVFTSSVSTSASEFNSVSASVINSVSPTVAFSSVSTTAFASVSKTLVDNKTIAPVEFELDGNKLVLEKEFGENDNVFVAFNNFVVKANYVPTVAINTVAAAEFSVYPNPVNDVLNVACEAGVANVAIFDIAGRMVKVSNEDVINVSDLKAGMYIVKVTDLNGATGTTKIMK